MGLVNSSHTLDTLADHLQCQLDDSSPLAKEWGLWAIRNLCAGKLLSKQKILVIGSAYLPAQHQAAYMHVSDAWVRVSGFA
jgi:hypothetical protein